MTGIGISEQGEKVIADFIHVLETEEDLKPKTVKEYGGDLKHFIGWFESEQLSPTTFSTSHKPI